MRHAADPLLPHPLTFVRHEHNWTQQDLVTIIARRLNTAARREKAVRWERWGVIPDGRTQLALAAELGVPSTTVRDLGWPHWLPSGSTIDIDLPWDADGALAALDRTAESASIDRRGFIPGPRGIVETMARQWRDAPTDADHEDDRDSDVAAFLGGRLPDLRRLESVLGGARVRNLADAELRLVTDLLLASAPAPRALFGLAAELARIAGAASADTGYHAAAERYWTASVRAAQAAGDRAAGAHALSELSVQRIEVDRPAEALVLATVAIGTAGTVPPRLRALLHVRLARAHAVMIDITECDHHLAEADRAMTEAGTDPDEVGHFDRAEYAAQVGACHLALGRPDTADRWISHALAHRPARTGRDRATRLLRRAEAALGMDRPEQACALVTAALPDIARARSARNRRLLTDICGRLATQPLPEVRELNGRVREFID